MYSPPSVEVYIFPASQPIVVPLAPPVTNALSGFSSGLAIVVRKIYVVAGAIERNLISSMLRSGTLGAASRSAIRTLEVTSCSASCVNDGHYSSALYYHLLYASRYIPSDII